MCTVKCREKKGVVVVVVRVVGRYSFTPTRCRPTRHGIGDPNCNRGQVRSDGTRAGLEIGSPLCAHGMMFVYFRCWAKYETPSVLLTYRMVWGAAFESLKQHNKQRTCVITPFRKGFKMFRVVVVVVGRFRPKRQYALQTVLQSTAQDVPASRKFHGRKEKHI